MISTEAAKRIKNYLYLNNRIDLPGIGNFKVYHIDQFLSNNETIIHPPFVKIKFNESVTNEKCNDKLSKYYFDKDIESNLVEHFQDVINDLLNFGSSDIAGLGIVKRIDDSKVIFIPHDVHDVANKYLPIIDTLSFQGHSKVASNEVLKDFSTQSKLPINNPGFSSTAINKNSTTVENNGSKDKVKHISSSARFNIWKILASLTFLLVCFFIVRQCLFNKTSFQNGGVDEMLMSIPAVTPSRDVQIDNEDYLMTKTVSSEESCIIILGTFNNIDNVRRLEDQIIKDGYKTVTSKHYSMTRVGIEFSCDNVDRKDLLNRIKSQYNKGAWYL